MNKKVEFFKRFQNHEKLRFAPEPERTALMKQMWQLWVNPTSEHDLGRGAASLLARTKGRR